jgi:hypothetical protein
VKAWKIRLHSWNRTQSWKSHTEPVSDSEEDLDWSLEVEKEKILRIPKLPKKFKPGRSGGQKDCSANRKHKM